MCHAEFETRRRYFQGVADGVQRIAAQLDEAGQLARHAVVLEAMRCRHETMQGLRPAMLGRWVRDVDPDFLAA